MNKDVLINKIVCLNKKTKKLFDKSIEELAKKFSLSKADIFVLSIIYHNPNLESCNIVKEHSFSKAYVSQAITSLKNNGYLKLTADENDKRYQKIELLDKSQEIIKCLDERFKYNFGVIKKNLTEEEMENMLIIIDKILNNISEVKEEKNA